MPHLMPRVDVCLGDNNDSSSIHMSINRYSILFRMTGLKYLRGAASGANVGSLLTGPESLLFRKI